VVNEEGRCVSTRPGRATRSVALGLTALTRQNGSRLLVPTAVQLRLVRAPWPRAQRPRPPVRRLSAHRGWPTRPAGWLATIRSAYLL